VTQATVGQYGLAGDREWQVVVGGGDHITQRQRPALARVQPDFVPGGLRLSCDGLPDIEVERPKLADQRAQTYFVDVLLGDAGDEAAGWLERVIGVPCRLASIAAGYTRPLPTELRDRFGGDVSLADAAPLLLANEASHQFLLERAAEPFGIERFRPNLVVSGAQAWAEDAWRTATVGGATLDGLTPWPRCAVPQIDQTTGEHHREPALVLKRYRWCAAAPDESGLVRAMMEGNALFGVACAVTPQGATIAVGDRVDVKVREESTS